MAIFSKRKLQKMLLQNRQILTEKQLESHIANLNQGGRHSLSTEWEVVVINALSKLGIVKYENLFETKTPDLFFSTENPDVSFLADITTVSDKGYEEENPIRFFRKMIFEFFKKNLLNPNAFAYEIGGRKGTRSIQLKMPQRKDFDQFFKGVDFREFILAIKKNPTVHYNLVLSSDDLDIKFYYNPFQKFSHGSHPAYNTAHSLTLNPVYNALKAKASQLKKTGYAGIKAIFLCDGHCDLLSNTLSDWQSYGLREIIREFFNKHSSIDFILIFTVRADYAVYGKLAKRTTLEFFHNPNKPSLPKEILHVICLLSKGLPVPANTMINAVERVMAGPEEQGNSFYGGAMVTEKRIQISARGLLELLSGRMEQKRFLEDHHCLPTPEHPNNRNYFLQKLSEGRLITNVRVEKMKEEDDDWIIFEFGNPDPAISMYKK